MTKLEFISELYNKLSDMPVSEIDERVNFYSEMIEDRIEEGLSEEEAVAAVGSVDEVADQIKAEIASEEKTIEQKKTDEQIKPENPKAKRSALEITLLVLGAPLWISLLAALFTVAISLIASVWAVVGSLLCVFASFCATALYGIIFGIAWMLSGKALAGLALFGCGLLLAGLAILSFFGCKALIDLCVQFTKRLVLWLFKRKRNEKCGKEDLK